MLLMRFLFDIAIMGSVLQLYLVGFLFMAAVLGLGMLLSTIAQTQMQATQMSMFFLLPFVFLSGYVFPIDGMPLDLPAGSRNVIPARYFIEVMRGIVLRGAALAELWQPGPGSPLHVRDHRAGGSAVQEDDGVGGLRRP